MVAQSSMTSMDLLMVDMSVTSKESWLLALRNMFQDPAPHPREQEPKILPDPPCVEFFVSSSCRSQMLGIELAHLIRWHIHALVSLLQSLQFRVVVNVVFRPECVPGLRSLESPSLQLATQQRLPWTRSISDCSHMTHWVWICHCGKNASFRCKGSALAL